MTKKATAYQDNGLIEPSKYKKAKKRNNSLHDLMWSVASPKYFYNKFYTKPCYSEKTNVTYATNGIRLVWVYGNPLDLNAGRDLESAVTRFMELRQENVTVAAKIPDLLQYKIRTITPAHNIIEWGKLPLAVYRNANISRYFDCRTIKLFSNWYYQRLSNSHTDPDLVQTDIEYCHNGRNYRPFGLVMPLRVEKAYMTLADSSIIAFID